MVRIKKNKKKADTCIPNLCIEWDKKGNIIKISQYLAEKCGYKIQENFNNKFKHIDELFIRPKFDTIKKWLKKEKYLSDLSVFIKHNTKERFVLTVDNLQFNEKSEKYKVLFKVESKSFDSRIADDAPSGMFISTPEGKFMMVNQTLVDLYGYKSKDEMLKIKDISQEIYAEPEDRQFFIEKITQQDFQEANKNKKIIEDFRYIAKRTDGRRILIKKYVIATYELGKISYFQGYVEDISQFMEESPLPYFRCDMKGNIIYANKALCQWLEYSEEDIYKIKAKQLYYIPEEARYWSKKLHNEKKLLASPRTFKSRSGKSIKAYVDVDVHLQERFGNPLYIEGYLSFNDCGAIPLAWVEELKKHLNNLNAKEYEIAIAQVNALKAEIKILDLNAEEIKMLAININRIVEEYRLNALKEKEKDTQSNSFFGKKYSLDRRIRLSVKHCLSFFMNKKELLKDSLTLSQVSQLFDLPEQEIRHRVSNKQMICIKDNQNDYFPLCQFDTTQKDAILSELPSVLKILKVSDLEKLSWLTRPNTMLQCRTPIYILKNGNEKEKHLVKVLHITLLFVGAIAFSCHNKVVLVQSTNGMSPPSYSYFPPFGQ